MPGCFGSGNALECRAPDRRGGMGRPEGHAMALCGTSWSCFTAQLQAAQPNFIPITGNNR